MVDAITVVVSCLSKDRLDSHIVEDFVVMRGCAQSDVPVSPEAGEIVSSDDVIVGSIGCGWAKLFWLGRIGHGDAIFGTTPQDILLNPNVGAAGYDLF